MHLIYEITNISIWLILYHSCRNHLFRGCISDVMHHLLGNLSVVDESSCWIRKSKQFKSVFWIFHIFEFLWKFWTFFVEEKYTKGESVYTTLFCVCKFIAHIFFWTLTHFLVHDVRNFNLYKGMLLWTLLMLWNIFSN